jgi:hypothetical protein
VATHPIHPDEPKNADQIRHYIQHTPAVHVGLGVGVLLVLLGLPQLYARLGRSTGAGGGGRMGGATGGLTLLSLPLIFFGLAVADGMHSPLEFGALPAIYRVVPDRVGEIYLAFHGTAYGVLSMIGAFVMMLGMLLFVIGVWRSRSLPRWPLWLVLGSLLAMVGAVVGVPMTGPLFAVLFYAGFGGYGALVLRTAAIDTRETAAAAD